MRMSISPSKDNPIYPEVFGRSSGSVRVRVESLVENGKVLMTWGNLFDVIRGVEGFMNTLGSVGYFEAWFPVGLMGKGDDPFSKTVKPIGTCSVLYAGGSTSTS